MIELLFIWAFVGVIVFALLVFLDDRYVFAWAEDDRVMWALLVLAGPFIWMLAAVAWIMDRFLKDRE